MTGAPALFLLSGVLTVFVGFVLRGLPRMLAFYFGAWTVVFAALWWNPVHLYALDGRTTAILAVGLLAVVGGAVAAAAWAGQAVLVPPAARVVPVWPVRARVLFPLLCVASVLLLAGIVAFRSSVEQAAGGTAFSDLSASQVRYLEVYGAASHAGFGTILYALAPVVAAGGILLARTHRLGYAFTLWGVVASATQPGRTATFYTALIALVTWLLSRQSRVAAGRRRRWPSALAVLVVAVGLAAYFQHQGEVLEKAYSGGEFGQVSLPVSLVAPTMYVTASPVALSGALETDIDPTFGEHGRTIWIVPRIASLLDSSVKAPNTVPQYAETPYPFNTYTWAGDLWFDFGWWGVVLGSLLLGSATVLLYRRARSTSSPLWQFYTAAWVAVLFSSLIAFEVFWLQTFIWVVAGALVLGPSVDRTVRRASAVPTHL